MSQISHAPPTPNDLIARWQAIGSEWSSWYAKAASLVSGGATAPFGATLPATPVLPTFDPQRLAELNAKYQARWQELWTAAVAALGTDPQAPASVPEVAHPAAGDRRFAAPEWQRLPYFSLIKQGYLLFGEYLAELATLAALPEHQKQQLAFITKQYIDALAPTNFVATNPEALKRALSTEGASLMQGLANLAADAQRGRISMSDESAFRVGVNLAVTPGSVVFRNELIELLQ